MNISPNEIKTEYTDHRILRCLCEKSARGKDRWGTNRAERNLTDRTEQHSVEIFPRFRLFPAISVILKITREMADVELLSIIFVTSGTRGDRLLFKYPFEQDKKPRASQSKQPILFAQATIFMIIKPIFIETR